MAFQFFLDPALTTEASGFSLLTMLDDGSAVAVPAVVYFGAADAGIVALPASGAAITVAPVDSDPAAGLPATAIRLALTEAGLATAAPGNPLALGTEIAGGVAGAVAIWIAADTGGAGLGSYTDLSLETSMIAEVPA